MLSSIRQIPMRVTSMLPTPPEAPGVDYFRRLPQELVTKVAKQLDRKSLVAFSLTSRHCNASATPALWFRFSLDYPPEPVDEARNELFRKNASHVRCMSITFHEVTEIVADRALFIFLSFFAGIVELHLTELNPLPWAFRCNFVAYLLTHKRRLEHLNLWFAELVPCPSSIALPVSFRHSLAVPRLSRLKSLSICFHEFARESEERGEYIFTPFLQLFSGVAASIEDFSFNILANPIPNMTAETLESEEEDLAQFGQISPLSMPGLKNLDMGALLYFENLSRFMTLESFANVTYLSVLADFNIPYDDVFIFGPPKLDTEDVCDTLQHFHHLHTLLISMDENVGSEHVPNEYWDLWAQEVALFCPVVPKLYRVLGRIGARTVEFVVLRTGAGILVSRIAEPRSEDVVDHDKNWEYWKVNLICID